MIAVHHLGSMLGDGWEARGLGLQTVIRIDRATKADWQPRHHDDFLSARNNSPDGKITSLDWFSRDEIKVRSTWPGGRRSLGNELACSVWIL